MTDQELGPILVDMKARTAALENIVIRAVAVLGLTANVDPIGFAESLRDMKADVCKGSEREQELLLLTTEERNLDLVDQIENVMRTVLARSAAP